MKTIDIMLKDQVVRMATSLPKATISALTVQQQLYSDYLLKVLNAPIDTQIAVRNAAAASGKNAIEQLSRILTALLSPAFRTVTTSLDAPTTLPAGSLGQPIGTVLAGDTTDFPASGMFRLNTSQAGQLVSYTGKTPASFTGCTGGSGSAGQGNVITFVTFEFDISAAEIQARRDTFIAAFTRRSRHAIGALTFINDKHIWSWNEIQPPVETRIQVPAF